MTPLPAAFAALAALRRFVTYRLDTDPDIPGKTAKRPTHWQTGVVCDAQDPANQTDYATAIATGRPIGFVFTAEDPYWFLDIDRCAEPGKWSPLAMELLGRFQGAGVEVSQSGLGLHIIGRGVVPPHGCKNTALGLEFYHEKRFVALTGKDTLGNVDTDHTAALAQLVVDYFPPNPHGEVAGWTDQPVEGWGGPTDDAELIKVACAGARKSAASVFGGAADVNFEDLWTANTEKLAAKWPGTSGLYDASQADASLATRLAYWTGKNCERIRDIMLQSGLARQKWEVRPDYLDTTIMNACSVVSGVAPLRADVLDSVGVEEGRKNESPLDGVIFDGDRLPAPPRELVKGLLPVEGIAFLGGQSSSGKTFVAVDLAVAVASSGANKFFGHDVRERVAVAIFAAEGLGTLSDRLHAAKEYRGISENLPIAYFAPALDLSNESDVTTLCKTLQDVSEQFCVRFGVRLGAVVIDTVAAAFGIDNENDNAEAARIIRNLRRLGDATGALILPVHHYGKSEDTGLRGASAFRAGADVILSVKVARNSATGEITNRTLALAKSRTREEGPISSFDLAKVTIGLDQDGEVFGSCAITLNDKSASSDRANFVPQSSLDFRAAFSITIEQHGVEQPQITGQSNGRAVQLSLVRAVFFDRRKTSNGDERKQNDAARKAFGNARKQLASEFRCARDERGTEWVWDCP